MSVAADADLTAEAFSTEATYDTLTVNGFSFSGTSGPTDYFVTAGANITWSTDGSITNTGFEVCAWQPTITHVSLDDTNIQQYVLDKHNGYPLKMLKNIDSSSQNVELM